MAEAWAEAGAEAWAGSLAVAVAWAGSLVVARAEAWAWAGSLAVAEAWAEAGAEAWAEDPEPDFRKPGRGWLVAFSVGTLYRQGGSLKNGTF